MRFACWRFTDRTPPAMVESYFNGEEVNIDEGVTRQGDEIEFFNISTLAQIDNAKNLTTIDAITWINHVDDSSKASVVFILIAMFSASFIMGVRYTARRMGGFFERRRVDFWHSFGGFVVYGGEVDVPA